MPSRSKGRLFFYNFYAFRREWLLKKKTLKTYFEGLGIWYVGLLPKAGLEDGAILDWIALLIFACLILSSRGKISDIPNLSFIRATDITQRARFFWKCSHKSLMSGIFLLHLAVMWSSIFVTLSMVIPRTASLTGQPKSIALARVETVRIFFWNSTWL